MKKRTNQTDLDAMLDADQMAAWLNITKPTLLQLVRRKQIPVVKLNSRLFRFHPRTVLDKF